MTTRYRNTLMSHLLAAALAATLAACGGGGEAGSPQMMSVDANGVSAIQGTMPASVLASYPLQALSSAELASLVGLREGEQLAHDIYTASARLWPAQPVFANISVSEATHTAAVKTLLDRYQLADPMAGRVDGSFPTLQTLYDSSAAASGISLVEALKVGVQIEELDIHDIASHQPGIDNTDILHVYDNLLRGSRNHLRSYMKLLLQSGGSYAPQYLTQTEFDAIVNSSHENGR
jgi:hypothetical protein